MELIPCWQLKCIIYSLLLQLFHSLFVVPLLKLGSHLTSNNALVFDMLGTDVDILRQFTPEHLTKYLEYNSGCKPIPIEQVVIPCVLNRDSLKLEVVIYVGN